MSQKEEGMFVIKRNGEKERVSFDKITARVSRLAESLEHVDPVLVSQKVVNGVFPGVKTSELDNLAAETAAYMSTIHPNYGTLAAKLAISNLQKETDDSFFETMKKLYNFVNDSTGLKAPLLSDEVYEIIETNHKALDSAIDYSRDFNYDYFGFKTLQKSYLLKVNGVIVERPQHMLMRVSVGIHKKDIDAAINTYNLMSQLYFTHASPTLFNSGTPRPQLSSCFLLTMQEDSIAGIYDTLKMCAQISKSAGGIGLAVHTIRASGSYIRGTNGYSNGLVPMLRVYNDTARYVDQGGARRPGAFAVYLEPWHADVLEFLEMKKNTGKEEQRARDLFYALWIPDLFMERVEANGQWSLMCPNECPGLSDVWGDEFKALYEKYEKEGKARKSMPAQEIWFAILESQVETGTPYMLYKDSCNRKSNQKNLGTIKSSNLCTEIVEYTEPGEVAVCNLASVALSKFVVVNGVTRRFDFDHLYQVVRVMTRNLNRIIDVNYYPVEAAKKSNMRHRPIGIGVQGLADAFILMRMPFESDGAKELNRHIFETMYFAALTESVQLAKEEGPYSTFEGSPASQGILQYDMWNVQPSLGKWDWNQLKVDIKKHGLRNSLLLAPMPTASTSQILGNNECFEPYTSNMYTRRVLAGEFAVINRHLLQDLIELGLWDNNMKNKIMAEGGSIQNIDAIPQDLKDLYKTVWEISQKRLIEMAADRGAFIDQSQSFNVHFKEASFSRLTSLHFYAWKSGLKTGMYYLRTQPAARAIQFTVDQQALNPVAAEQGGSTPKKRKVISGEVCTMQEGCISCSG